MAEVKALKFLGPDEEAVVPMQFIGPSLEASMPAHAPTGSSEALDAGMLPNTQRGPAPVKPARNLLKDALNFSGDPTDFKGTYPPDVGSVSPGVLKNYLVGSIPGINTYREIKNPTEEGFFPPGHPLAPLGKAGHLIEAGAADFLNAVQLGQLLKPVVRGAKVLSKFGPEEGARTLNDLAPQEAEAVVARLAPQQGYKQLFDQATESGVQIPVSNTSSRIDDLIDELISTRSKEAQPKAVIKYLNGLKDKIAQKGGSLTPADIQGELAGLGEKINEAKVQGGTGLGKYKDTFGAIYQDLNEAADAGVDASGTLKLARDTFRRKTAVDEIQDSIEAASKINRGQGGNIQFNGNQVIKDLKKNDFFTKSFNAKEQEEIFDLFKKLNKIPVLKPPQGAKFGSGPFWQGARSIAAGAGIGEIAGGTPGAVIGAAAGAVVPPSVLTAQNIAQAMQFEVGRNMIKAMLASGAGEISERNMAIIAAFVASQTRPKNTESPDGNN